MYIHVCACIHIYIHIFCIYTHTLSLSLYHSHNHKQHAHTSHIHTHTYTYTSTHLQYIHTPSRARRGNQSRAHRSIDTRPTFTPTPIPTLTHTSTRLQYTYTPARARRGNQSRAHRGIEASRRHDHYLLFSATAAPHMMGTSAAPRRFYSLTCAGCVCVCVWRGGECVNVCVWEGAHVSLFEGYQTMCSAYVFAC